MGLRPLLDGVGCGVRHRAALALAWRCRAAHRRACRQLRIGVRQRAAGALAVAARRRLQRPVLLPRHHRNAAVGLRNPRADLLRLLVLLAAAQPVAARPAPRQGAEHAPFDGARRCRRGPQRAAALARLARHYVRRRATRRAPRAEDGGCAHSRRITTCAAQPRARRRRRHGGHLRLAGRVRRGRHPASDRVVQGGRSICQPAPGLPHRLDDRSDGRRAMRPARGRGRQLQHGGRRRRD